MPLTPADDYQIHQTPETMDRVNTSDRNFYDRYFSEPKAEILF